MMIKYHIRNFTNSSIVDTQLRKVLKKSISSNDPSKFIKFTKLKGKKSGLKPSLSNNPPQIKQITRQHAAHLLNKITGEQVDLRKLGPETDEDLKYFPVATKQILLTLLGTTSNQLLDSVIVDKSVKSFLKRNQIEKALMISRLAKNEGVVSMNRIMKFYLDQGKLNKSIELFNWRKKWQIPVNNHTYTILFNGFANYKNGLSENQIQEIKKILLNMDENSNDIQPNLIHINSAFQAMLNTRDAGKKLVGLKIFHDWLNDGTEKNYWFKNIKPNKLTYSIILRSLAYESNPEIVLANCEWILPKIMALREIDYELIESWCFPLLKSNNLQLLNRGFDSINHFFKFDSKIKSPFFILLKNSKILDKTDLNWEFNELPVIKFKFIPKISLIDTIMHTYLKFNSLEQSLKIFKEFSKDNSIDLILFHRFIKSSQHSPLEFYEMLQKFKLIPTEATNFLIFDSIYRKSLQNLNDLGKYCIGSKAFEIFQISESFCKDQLQNDLSLIECLGYLKSLRRLRLSQGQIETVLKRIEDTKTRNINSIKDDSLIKKLEIEENYFKNKYRRKINHNN
ncbi:hypothetical protein WICMUC_000562 [Wickerhamomyces mucosus]|uniref:Uncharacterized protein n=1 Tax=Wickerhamomyces mucosus TaxID=1378264 RepID=A0A9P8TIJ1_9ASCO|nr:hypothetical protein WICMUC_000562 [Wickerhamomyces mucosus]